MGLSERRESHLTGTLRLGLGHGSTVAVHDRFGAIAAHSRSRERTRNALERLSRRRRGGTSMHFLRARDRERKEDKLWLAAREVIHVRVFGADVRVSQSEGQRMTRFTSTSALLSQLFPPHTIQISALRDIITSAVDACGNTSA
jgi:hypothetical protein